MKKKDILAILSVTDDPIDLYKITTEYELQDMMPDIERAFRSSREYKAYVFWQKSRHNQSVCSENKYDSYDYNNLTLELHHYPISLYDIAYTIGLKKLSELPEDALLTTFSIVDELIRVHFENNVGIVPLLKSWHQMYHEGLYNIAPEQIHGNYQQFLETYKPFLSDKLLNLNVE